MARKVDASLRRYVEPGVTLQMGEFTVTPFTVPHDSSDNVGYFIEADKKLDTKEVSLLLEICRALDCNLAKMICTIAIFAQNDRDIKIEGNDADFTEELVEE